MVVVKRVARPSKTSKARKKIEIKKIDNKSSQQVTFSKRLAGLFKKASKLYILCGAQVAIIMFSPVHKVFSFGHSNADAIIERYLTCGRSDEELPVEEFAGALPIQALNQQYDDVMKELGVEKRKEKEGVESERAGSTSGFGMGTGAYWWEEAMHDDIPDDELEPYVAALEALIRRITLKSENIMMRSLLQPYVGNERTVDGFEICSLLG